MQSQHKVGVLISGSGPAALAVAIESVKVGKSVFMISDRKDEYTRVQRVYLNEENRKYLLKFISEDSILNTADEKLKNELIENMTLQIKDIERYMKRRLDELNMKTKLVNFVYNSSLDSIDCENGIAMVAGTQIEFNYLIGADGAYHHTANVFNQSTKNEKIEYEVIESTEHPYHGNFYLLIKRKDGKVLEIPSDEYLMSVQQIVYEGEALDSLCYTVFGISSYNQSNKKSLKCNFIGELPASLYRLIKSNDSKATIDTLIVLKQVISTIFEKNELNNGELDVSIIKPSQKYGLQKNKVKFIAFETEISQANKAAIQEGKICFMLVGDAFRKPNYQIGHGLNDALSQASWIGNIFKGAYYLPLDVYNIRSNNSFNAYSEIISLLKTNKHEFVKIAKADITERTKYLKNRELVSFFKTMLLPAELEELIKYGGLDWYIDNHYTTQDQLLELYKTKPWVLAALKYFNIRAGVNDKFIDIEQLSQLTKEQISEIINFRDRDDKLRLCVESYIFSNRKKL